MPLGVMVSSATGLRDGPLVLLSDGRSKSVLVSLSSEQTRLKDCMDRFAFAVAGSEVH